MHWRTHVVDVSSPCIEGKEAYEIADSCLTSTVAAIMNDAPLLDFDEYKAI